MRAFFPFMAILLTLRAYAGETAGGVTAGVNVTLEASVGVNGGARTGETFQALSIGHVAWQSAPANASATSFRSYVSILNHEGNGPTARFLGDFLAASNIEAYSSTRFYSWWFEAEQASWSLRAGALLADEEFAGTESGGHFSNSVFGWPAFISANTVNTGPAFYAAAAGLRLAHALTLDTTWRVGIYDGDTFDSTSGDPAINRHGLHYQLGGGQGWFTITEVSHARAGSPTRLKLGAWHHTAKFADNYLDSSGEPFAVSGRAPRDHTGNYGAYITVEHALAGVPEKPGYIDCFARFGGAPADRNTLSWAFDSGVAWTGFFPARPSDVVALGFAHAQFSPQAAAAARLFDPTAPPLDSEQVVEASYTFQLSDHFSCKPDVQFIRHPSGNSAHRDATLVMIRLIADF